jgi:hypothetical protein
MSRYSGKCDVYDSVIMISKYTDEELAHNVTIYQGYGEDQKKLNISCRKDLIPYYAYLVSSACYNNVERKAVIHITRESFVDREERDSLEFKLKNVLRIYNRCKRKKTEFDVNATVEEVAWKGFDDDIYREIANRVKEHGKKANVDGIHLKMHEYYRKELVKEMIDNGINPLDYGDYARFM